MNARARVLPLAPATLDQFAEAYLAMITPTANLQAWLEGGILDGADRVAQVFHQLVDQRLAEQVAAGHSTADDPLDHEIARSEVLFEAGVRIGRVLGGAR